jgi:hypothetical protein
MEEPSAPLRSTGVSSIVRENLSTIIAVTDNSSIYDVGCLLTQRQVRTLAPVHPG